MTPISTLVCTQNRVAIQPQHRTGEPVKYKPSRRIAVAAASRNKTRLSHTSARRLAAILLSVVLFLIAGSTPVHASPTPTPSGSGTATTAQPNPVCPSCDVCPRGVSCYYDGHDAHGKIWQAPGCGFFNLGTMSPARNDKISSILNNGTGDVTSYNWVSGHWQMVGTHPTWSGGWLDDFYPPLDNIIDAVNVAC
jgi:hypothetical protein